MMTKTISGVAVTNLPLATNQERLNIVCVEGKCNGTAGTLYYLQLFNAANPTTTVTVPVRSWVVQGQAGFTFEKNPNGLQAGNFFNAVDVGGLYFYLSSTDGVYTALADGATVDVNFDVESFGLDAGGLTKVTANAVSNVTVFADPNVSKAMYSATITDVSGAASYVQLFAKAPTAGLVPIVVWPLAANATLSLNFGSSGEKSYDTEDANGTLHSGMYFGFSSVAGVYDGAGSCNATAYYK